MALLICGVLIWKQALGNWTRFPRGDPESNRSKVIWQAEGQAPPASELPNPEEFEMAGGLSEGAEGATAKESQKEPIPAQSIRRLPGTQSSQVPKGPGQGEPAASLPAKRDSFDTIDFMDSVDISDRPTVHPRE